MRHVMNAPRFSVSRLLRAVALTGTALLASTAALAAGQVNLYTTREPGLIQPLLDAFTKQSGIKVNTVFIKDGLAERVAAEGKRSPAVLLRAVAFGNMLNITDNGLAQPVKSKVLEDAVPAQLRDAEGRWFSLSMRARVLYAAKNRDDISAINYEDLADPKWK